MENKKYKIGDKIEKEEIEKVVKGIARKAINVIATNGDKIALELQENKHIDLYNDILQEIALQLILNDYIITKKAFQIVRSYIYKKNKEIIELIIDTEKEEEEKENFLNKLAYIKYINEYNEEEKTENIKIYDILEEFTERQKEIINIYSKINSMQQTADILGIAKGTVNNTIRRLRDKIQDKKYELKIA